MTDRRDGALIGWREVIALPDLGVETMRAKIDTGARTSALHATHQEVFERDGERWVRFAITQGDRRSAVRHEARIHDERAVKNTSGAPETRIFIRTMLRMGARRWRIEASLADRAKMEFDMILGRTAIRRRGLVVDAGRSYVLPLTERPPAKRRRRNRRSASIPPQDPIPKEAAP